MKEETTMQEYPIINKPQLASQLPEYRDKLLEMANNNNNYEDICNQDGTVIITYPLIQLFLSARNYPKAWKFQYKKDQEFIIATNYSERIDLYWTGVWKLPTI